MKVIAKVGQPDIIAVRIRHDLCPLCKKLDPRFPDIVRDFNGQSVLFVTLDLTDQTTQKQAALLTGALGLDSVWTGDLSRIGSVTIMDGPSRRTLSYAHTTDVDAIRRALDKAVKTHS